MKQRIRNLALTIAFCTVAHSVMAMIPPAPTTNQTIGHTFFSHRPQGSNLARDLVGVTQFIAPCDIDCLNGFLAITPEYSRNFNRDEIGRFFFYNGTNTMSFGQAVAAGGNSDVFARNLFLNDDFSGTATILPRAENFIVDLHFRLNLDEWICGLYFDIHAPINWTRWDINLTQNIVSAGTTIAQFALGNNTGDPLGNPSPVNTLLQAFNGQQLNTAVFTDLKQELRFGRVDGSQSKAGVADITAAIGYNFICNECAHLGVDIRALFPTGTRPDAEFLFEPIIGNGKHFGIGFDINGSYEFWNNCCDSSFSVWAEFYGFHLFKARQRRIFDLNNPDTTIQNIGSHQLLIKKFSGGLLTEILFGPNVLARELKVRNDFMGEAVILFDYQRCGFTLDFGYNFWFRSKDKISNIEPIEPETFGLAGNTLGTGGVTANFTGSTAKINGADGASDGTIVFITTDDLSIESVAHPQAMSHKVFAHAQYAWDNCDYTPFLGAGGAVEFSGRRNNAFDQWEVWLKGGFAFM